MNVHKNARLTRDGRERIVRQVESGQAPVAVAEAAGVCPRTVRKWIDRCHRECLGGSDDRSSRPHRLHRPTPEAIVQTIERMSHQRWTGKQIAAKVGVSPATVSRVLHRLGLNKLGPTEEHAAVANRICIVALDGVSFDTQRGDPISTA